MKLIGHVEELACDGAVGEGKELAVRVSSVEGGAGPLFARKKKELHCTEPEPAEEGKEVMFENTRFEMVLNPTLANEGEELEEDSIELWKSLDSEFLIQVLMTVLVLM